LRLPSKRSFDSSFYKRLEFLWSRALFLFQRLDYSLGHAAPLGAAVLPATSFRDFLEENADRFSALFGGGEGFFEIAGSLDGADFHWSGFGLAAGEEKESEKKTFHGEIEGSGRLGILGKAIFAGRLRISR
jgi:hypothetical protein